MTPRALPAAPLLGCATGKASPPRRPLNSIVRPPTKMAATESVCASCGKAHELSDLELTFFRPDSIVAMPKDQREMDVKETDDLCSIRMERFFVRAVLPLPVEEWASDYAIGLWVEVSETSFFRIVETWRNEDQDQEPAMEARLANRIPHLPDTLDLPVRLRLTGPRTRPTIDVQESEHPLHREQCIGITPHRASQYTDLVRVEV